SLLVHAPAQIDCLETCAALATQSAQTGEHLLLERVAFLFQIAKGRADEDANDAATPRHATVSFSSWRATHASAKAPISSCDGGSIPREASVGQRVAAGAHARPLKSAGTALPTLQGGMHAPWSVSAAMATTPDGYWPPSR